MFPRQMAGGGWGRAFQAKGAAEGQMGWRNSGEQGNILGKVHLDQHDESLGITMRKEGWRNQAEVSSGRLCLPC